MISDAALAHLKRKMDGFRDLATFAQWWTRGNHAGIGEHFKTIPEVWEYKEQTKRRLGG